MVNDQPPTYTSGDYRASPGKTFSTDRNYHSHVVSRFFVQRSRPRVGEHLNFQGMNDIFEDLESTEYTSSLDCTMRADVTLVAD